MSGRELWPQVPLGELCEVSIGRTPSRAEPRYWGPGHPWLSIADMNQGRDLQVTKETVTDAAVTECSCRPVPAGTLVVSFKLSVGKVGILGRPMFTNEAIASLRFRTPADVDTGFMYHALRALDWSRTGERAVKGVTLNIRSLSALTVPLPPLAEQRRIAATLDRADAIARKRRESLRLLDAFLRSAFLEMFGDPVRNEMKWEVVALGELVQAERPITYGILKPGPDTAGGVPYVRVVDMAHGTINHAGVRRTTNAISHAYRRSTLRVGDVLLSIRGHVGRLAVVPAELEHGNITQDTARLSLLPTVEREYVVACLESTAMRALMRKQTRGVAVTGINLGDVRRLPIPLPGQVMQRRFARVAGVARAVATRVMEASDLDGRLLTSLAGVALS